MQNSSIYKQQVFKNSYLLILAAWLITFSFIIDNYWSGNSSAKAVQKQIEQNIQTHEKDFEKLLTDTALIGQIDYHTLDEPALLLLAKKPYFIFRYFVNDIGLHQISFWNTQTVLPTEQIIAAKDSTGFIKLDNGYYTWNKKTTVASISIALIPVKWNYFVINTYLENKFAAGKEIERNYDISDKKSGTSIKSVTGNILFYLVEKASQVIPKNNMIAVWFRIIAALFVLIFIHLLAAIQ